jgi:hypothetical protein
MMLKQTILCGVVFGATLWAQQPLLQVVFPQDGEVEVPLLGPITVAARYPILASSLRTRSPLPDEQQADSVLPTVVVLPEYLADTTLRSLWGVLALPGSVVLQSDTLLQFLPDTGAWDYGQSYVLWVNAVAMVRDSAGHRDTLLASLGPIRFTTVLPLHRVVRNTLWERSAMLLCSDTICLQFNRVLPQGLEVEQFVQLFRLRGNTAEAVEPSKYMVYEVDSTALCIVLRGVEPGGYWLVINWELITGEAEAREYFPFVVPERALFRVRVGSTTAQDSAAVAARLLPWLLQHSRFGRALGQELRLEAPAAVDTFCFWRWRVFRNGIEVLTVDTPAIVLRVDTCTHLALWELVAQYKRAEKDTIRLRRACVVDQEMEIDYDVVIVDGYADSLDMFTYTVWKLPWAHLRISVHRSDTTGGYYHTVRWSGTAPGYERVLDRLLIYRPVTDCGPGRLYFFTPCMELRLQPCTTRQVCIRFVQERPINWDPRARDLPPFDTCAIILWSLPDCDRRCEQFPIWDRYLRFAVRLYCDTTGIPDCWEITGWTVRQIGARRTFPVPVCAFSNSVELPPVICEVDIDVYLRPRLDTLWIALSARDGAYVRDAWEQKLIGVELQPPPLVPVRIIEELSDTLVRVGHIYRCADTVNVRPWADSESGLEVRYWLPPGYPWVYPDGSATAELMPNHRDTLRHVFRSDFRLVSVGFLRPDGSVEEIPASELRSSLVPDVGMVQLGGHSRAWRQHDRTTQVYLTFSHPVDTATLRKGIDIRDWGAGGAVFRFGGREFVFQLPRLQDGEMTTIYGCRTGPGGNAMLSKGGNRVIVTLIDSTGLFIPHWQTFEIRLTEELRSRSGARLRNPETVLRRTQLPSLEVRLRSLRVSGGYESELRGDQEVVLFLAFAAGVDSLRAALRDAMRLPSNDGYYEVPNEGGEIPLSRTLVTYAHGALTERTIVTVGFAAFEKDQGGLDENTMRILETVLENLANMVLDSVARSLGVGKLIAHVAVRYVGALFGSDDDYICSSEEVLRAENWWHGRLATLNPEEGRRWYGWRNNQRNQLSYFYDWHRIPIPALPLPPNWPPAARLELEVLLK